MKEPKWLTERMVAAIHQEAVAQFGGSQGVRNAAPLHSALDKPRQTFAYSESATLFELAASLCDGLTRNHPLVDGNRRTALLAARAFLFLNGWAFEPEEGDEVETTVAFATRKLVTEEMVAWFERHSTRRRRSR